MNYKTSWRSKPTWLVAIAGIFVVMSLILLAQQNRVAADGDNERVVTVFDGASEQTFVTTASTVKEALQRASISVTEYDAIEPRANTELVAKNYNVNIYRARPVVVVDGEQRINVMSPHKSARQVVEKAGIKLHQEDEAIIERVESIETEAIAAQKITIDRAVTFSLVLYGKKAEVRTQSKTVADYMQEKSITLGANDSTSIPLTQPIVEGMTLEIWRDGKQTITEEQEVTFPTRQIQDKDRELGFKELRTAGKNGKKVVTYEIEMKNGKEVARNEVQSVVTEQPVEQVEVVGAKRPITYTGGREDWMRAAGIPESEWQYVDFIVRRESGWNPNALNVSSGACGLAQALPCSKIPGDWTDPVNSLRWQYGYVKGRYGGYAQAYDFWQANRWY